MPYGIYLSAAGAHVQNHRLEVLSNNLANINTPGFKPSLAVLQARHNKAIEDGQAYPGSGRLEDIGGGVKIQPSLTLFDNGPMEQTGNSTDFAINNKNNFFVVKRGDEQLLTRAGGFIFNAGGEFKTTAGDPVVGADGNSITIDPSQPYRIHDDGTIQQAGARLSLMVMKPENLGDLAHAGSNMFRPMGPVNPAAATERGIVSGHLEKSSVNPTSAMMELIEASRAYESNLRLIQHQDQAYGNLIGRVLKE